MTKKIATLIAVVALITAPAFALAATFDRQLEEGMRGTDVSALQTYLAQDVTLYPQGLVTGYFGMLTKSAVSNFQARNGLPAVGRVGPMTLPVLNLAVAGGNPTGADMSAPLISNINVSKSSTSATITFNTNDMSRGKVYYSTSPIRLSNTFDQTGMNSGEPSVTGTLANYDGVARSSQSIAITGLTPNTTYYYQIVVLDSANNASISLPASFIAN